jgi:hypothetical protein
VVILINETLCMLTDMACPVGAGIWAKERKK